MATTKLGNTKSASRAINYAEKRAEEKSGLNCDVDYAKSAFKQTRALYGKENGIQAHTVIQSFKPGEVTPEQCNQLGLELAEKIAPNHQVAVYTHTDKDHYHNHIVINSVDLETGKKYQSNKKQRELVKQSNDNVCREHGLSVTERGTAKMRYTQAEKGIVFDREEYSWKDELRDQIENAKAHTSNLETFSEHLREKGIEVKLRGETISYKPENANKWVRGRTLGSDYEKGAIDDEHERHEKLQREAGDDIRIDWHEFERRTEEYRARQSSQTREAKQYHSSVCLRYGRETARTRETTKRTSIEIEKGDSGISR
ncbi:relaxase/mobilization nuclease domain-containing protein [Staphylococcus kloosii]|uniref:relaxase/mobilization nuclease domain-containing protein n=1 Tax=Staphylococcus kloosii TaxID=29384 RepID=UPI00189D3E58|nr:relaxase/mobilization nuclease domain-containing protein [Staphylococcus kloosii]MBF7023303.1 relaxase/mobilization nuclease domain-containing protein [Staphylococcus kloosii]MBF7025972.1 relaxase/mobilization nuclease domain-containing protein [Staphylococcus kloosii]